MRQAWIHKSWFDIAFILSPPFLCFAIIYLFPGEFFSLNETTELPDFWWLILILGVDVAHVYSTLYRTYFDKETFQYYKTIYTLIPILVVIFNVITFSISPVLFWSLLAYLAVFHFIRQQYGFYRIYARNERNPKWMYWLDTISIYSLTVYPILYWHLTGPKFFNWFMPNDFYFFESDILLKASTWLYFILLIAYVVKEILVSIKNKHLNIGKNLLWIGTAVSWYFGIIYFKGDLTFTILNVVTHGIPYMALIWIYGNKKRKGEKPAFLKLVFSPKGVLVFCALIILFGYAEEGLWNAWIWKDRDNIFPIFNVFSPIQSKELMSLAVGILATPQLTHYVLDAFIWKMRKDKEGWQSYTLQNSASGITQSNTGDYTE
jgi:hypothetical protein